MTARPAAALASALTSALTSTSLRPRRRGAAAAVAAGVLVLHAAVLGWLPRALAPGARGDAPRPLQVRQIVPAPHAAAEELAPLAARPEPPARTAPTAEPATAAPAPPAPATEAADEPVDAPSAGASTEPAAPLPVIVSASVASTAPLPEDEYSDGRLPVYTTRLPPPARLLFELKRGALSGQAELAWRPGASGYELVLESTVAGLPALGSASRGGFDAAGIAPLRLVDRRRGREVRAVNFQREAGIISFSGPQHTYPLPPGAQDRLSWMLQLPAILEANPALGAPGAQVLLFVAGARGDADVWTFTVQGRERLDLPSGPVPDALHLQRQPRRAYDTQVEIWLDPARHHLPVQARLLALPAGEATELRLQRLLP